MFKSCYSGRRLVVDLEKKSFQFDPIEPSEFKNFVGGRGLNAYYAYTRKLHLVDAFSERNELLIAPGALVGMPCLYANRMTLTSKSPLTGLLGDSNVGGDFGVFLKWAEVDQVVIQGKSATPCVLIIKKNSCLFEDASDLWGKDVGEAEEFLRQNYGQVKRFSSLTIGPGGENRVRFASVHSGAHAAGRTGLGAVMGDKRIKAIVVQGGIPRFDDLNLDKGIMQRLNRVVKQDPSFPNAQKYGATTAIEGFNKIGVLEVKNLQTGVWDQHEKISGKYLRDTFTVKHYGCIFCNIQCKGISRFINETGGEYEVHGPEFAAMQNYGARILNSDLPSVCKMTKLSNNKGVDFMSMGAILSWLMECLDRSYITGKDLDGIGLGWGKVDESIELIQKVALREGVGNTLAEGGERTSRVLGEKTRQCLLTVKGMEFEGCDPRGYKGRGVGYGVASRGADNCRSLGAFESVLTKQEAISLFGSEEAASLTGVRGKGRLLKYIEDYSNVADLLGLCRYGMFVFATNLESILERCDLIYDFYSHVSGFDSSDRYKELAKCSERLINLERIMNLENGCGREEDLLPKRFRIEPMPEGPAKGNVVENEAILDEYYEARGWHRNGTVGKEKQTELFGGVLHDWPQSWPDVI